MESTESKPILFEGIRVGLKAFIITYLFAFIISVVINFSLMGRIQDYLQGTLVQDVGFDFGLVVKTTSLLMNLSVFNAAGTFKLGILVFLVLPFLAFFIADRRDNRERGMGFVGILIYMLSSVIYTLLLQLLSFISKGDFLGIEISFVSFRNIAMTFVVTMLVQMIIGLNYDMHRLPGIIATRWMFRIVFGISFVLSLIGVIYGVGSNVGNVALVALSVLVLVPNLAVYLSFMMMGISVELNSELEQLMSYLNIDMSYATIPLYIRIAFLAVFVIAVFVSLYKLNQENYGRGILGFALTYPLVCLCAAICTEVDLGGVKFIGNIQFGINHLSAFMFPLIAIIAMSLFDLLLRRLQAILKE